MQNSRWETGPLTGKKEHSVQLCPGVHSEHSLMDTRVGPIEHSQMDPTEGNRPFDGEEEKNRKEGKKERWGEEERDRKEERKKEKIRERRRDGRSTGGIRREK